MARTRRDRWGTLVREATDVVEILRGDGMPDLAEMVDVANTRGRMTRWLHR
ncbi:hypothetical protein RKD19_001489 [Streptomyces canus]|uniref:hypothetical protein n=1 Tax=Streptomyces sp. RP5T TaxID=2490848 RepID=UPI00163A358D|nr:hypothetical protein [Streptomyces sp. RP5T]